MSFDVDWETDSGSASIAGKRTFYEPARD